MRAPPAAARTFAESARMADALAAGADAGFRSVVGAAGEAGACTEVSPGGFPDSALLPPIANTWSCDARPPAEEVGVPPTVIATYSLPPDGEDRRPGGDLAAGLERPQDLARLRVERAEHAVAAAGEAEAGRRQADPAPLGLRRVELPDPLAGRDVDRADRAVILPARAGSRRSCRCRARGRCRRAGTCASSASASASSGSGRRPSRRPRCRCSSSFGS